MANPPSARRLKGLPIQVKYTMFLTLISGFMLLVMIFVMGWFIQRNYDLFMGDELGVSSQVVEIVRREQHMLEMSLFLLFLISLSVICVTTFFVIRKLTGPIVAVHRQLAFFAEGDFSRDFRLRKDDEFRELEMLFKRVRSLLDEKTQKLRA